MPQKNRWREVGFPRLHHYGGPDIYNIEIDPREEISIDGDNAWVIAQWIRIVSEYNQALKEHTNPRGVRLADTGHIVKAAAMVNMTRHFRAHADLMHAAHLPYPARGRLLRLLLFSLGIVLPAFGEVGLQPADSVSGYIARLLINESPFPGERGWLSEDDTRGAMVSILWVLDSRIHHVPPGYTQEQIAAVRSHDIIDVITVGGEKGQCDGFYRDTSGQFRAVARVHERIDYLLTIANKGKPGRFARLINYAQHLANAYVSGGIGEADRFAGLSRIGNIPVTGRAYSWMTDQDYYHPGGNFLKIPNSADGALGGNRFFTLRRIK